MRRRVTKIYCQRETFEIFCQDLMYEYTNKDFLLCWIKKFKSECRVSWGKHSKHINSSNDTSLTVTLVKLILHCVTERKNVDSYCMVKRWNNFHNYWPVRLSSIVVSNLKIIIRKFFFRKVTIAVWMLMIIMLQERVEYSLLMHLIRHKYL